MQVMWRFESDNNDIDGSGIESGDEKKLNVTLMARVDDDPSPIDIDGIITSKNISSNKTIELFRNIALSKNKELKSQQQASTLTSLDTNEVFLNSFYDNDDYDFDERREIDDSSISLSNKIKYQNYDRL
jgi:hypothetical protein